MLAVLTPIWERAFQRSPIRPDDDFFDLGGDPGIAAAPFAEISRVVGREVPISMIYHARTVADLAIALGRSSTYRYSPIVLLKPGSEPPPIFMAHGLGGTMIELSHLAKHLRCGHPVYGVQARGLDGTDVPHDRVEAMAQHFLDAIGKVQSHGPYVLVGNSFGGLVTLEVARHLCARGEEVAFLGLLDTYPHPKYWPLRAWLAVLHRRAVHHISSLRHLKSNELAPYIHRRLVGLHGQLRSRHGGFFKSESSQRHGPNLSSLGRVIDSGIAALAHYQPQYYPGKISFVRAETTTRFPENASAIWGGLVRELETYTVPGDHVAMSTVYAESLAAQLSRRIETALGST